jgi:amylosucrase
MLVMHQAILSRLETQLHIDSASTEWLAFKRRLDLHGDHLRALLFSLYGQRADFEQHFEAILLTAAQAWLERAHDLKKLDAAREADPRWFQSHHMLGGIVYVDLFAGDLSGLRAKLPYFKEMGLTYLHLMPLFKAPADNSDGGYAVSTYREVNSALGTMQQLRELAGDLREAGISLCLDFIFNHTSDEHAWAQRAFAGDPHFRDYYFFLPRREADAYDRHLREIFPEHRHGSFTPLSYWTHETAPTTQADDDTWVWTTFNSFQLDLRYENPAVFNAMAGEMLFIANIGVEVLRMDAVAFIWKQLGTTCENLPEAHTLIQAFNALARIAAPALIFKSEAIVHPNDVAKYIRPDECQISYNPLLMALLWNSLATRKARLLSQAIAARSTIHADCGWVNYVRCHDDIGWTFSDEDAAAMGINGFDHRRFLNQFYTGRFEGSFARGVPFQENPKTGDCRISGTCASLAGLEAGLQSQDEVLIALAIRRILLIHGIAMSHGGVPLIYMGDEIGMVNDYGYRADPHKAGDSRWVHRPMMDWANAELRHTTGTPQARIYEGLMHMIAWRRQLPAFANLPQHVATGNDHVLGFAHYHDAGPVLVLANFSEQAQTISGETLRQAGFAWPARDLISNKPHDLHAGVTLAPLQLMWMKAEIGD